jgi:hypothetical protein
LGATMAQTRSAVNRSAVARISYDGGDLVGEAQWIHNSSS